MGPRLLCLRWRLAYVGGDVRSVVLKLSGVTRHVLLVGPLAVKVPALWSWKMFLCGLLANMQEREFSSTGWPELCPVLCGIPGGWLIVMRRADDVPETISLDYQSLIDRPAYRIPAEAKRSSWGILNGSIVAVDYGS